MSRPAGKLYHPTNGFAVDTWAGFSWPTFFAGCFWYLVKGMGLWFIFAFLLALCTFGLSWFVLPFLSNEQHRNHLLKQGYLTEDQWHAKNVAA